MIMVVSTLGSKIKEQQKVQELQSMEDLGSLLLTEFRLAANSEPGFEKEFELPRLLSGKLYTLDFNSSFKEITIELNNKEYVIFIPTDLALEGNLTPGRNKIIRSSDKVIFNTLESVDLIPPAMIDDLTITDSGLDWVELSWTAVGDDGYIGRADYYILGVSAMPITDSNWNSINLTQLNIIPQENGSLESFIVQGLNSGTRYYFAIRAVDDAGNQGGISNNAFGITLPKIGFYALGDNLTVFSLDNDSLTELVEHPIKGDRLISNFKTLYVLDRPNNTIKKYSFNQLANITLSAANNIDQVLDMSLNDLGNNLLVAIPTRFYVLNSLLQELGSLDLSGITFVKSYNNRYGLVSQQDFNRINMINTTNVSNMNILSYIDLGFDTGLVSLTLRNDLLIASSLYYVMPITGSLQIINLSNVSNLNTIESFGLDCEPISTAINGLLVLVTCYDHNFNIPKLLILDNALSMLFETQTINLSEFEDVSLITTARDFAVIKAGNKLVLINISDPYNSTIAYSYQTQQGINSITSYDYEGVSDLEPPADIKDLNIEDSNYFNITLNWTSVGDDNYSGRVLHYDLRFSNNNLSTYWDYAEKALPPPRPNMGGDEQEFTLKNLIPGVNYYIGLRAVDSSGNWNELSNIVNATTKPALLILNASSSYNSSWDNLSCFLQPQLPQNVSATTIYSWTSSYGFRPTLLLPFDSSVTEQIYGAVRDYSGTTNVTLGLPSQQETIPQWVDNGALGGAYSFDGNDVLVADESNALEPKDDFTFEAWVKPLDKGVLFDNHNQTQDLPSNSEGFIVRIKKLNDNEAKLELIIQKPGSGARAFDSAETLLFNEWHHIVIVRDYNTKRFYGYVDGVLVLNITDDYPSFTNKNKIVIGGNYNDATGTVTDYFKGFIDEVRFYPLALSSEELLLHAEKQYNKISNTETVSSETWHCKLVINKQKDMVELESNNITLQGEVLIAGGLFYNENTNELAVYEFDDNHNLSLIDNLKLSDDPNREGGALPHGLCIQDNRLFFNEGEGDVGNVDISRLKSLKLIDYYNTSLPGFNGLSYVGDMLCMNDTIYSSLSYNGVYSFTKNLELLAHDSDCELNGCYGSFFSLADYNGTTILADIEDGYLYHDKKLRFYNNNLFLDASSITLFNLSTRMIYDKEEKLLITGERSSGDQNLSIRMYNLSNLTQPVLIDTANVPNKVLALAKFGDIVFVGTKFNASKNETYLLAFNISNTKFELLANITIRANKSMDYNVQHITDISVTPIKDNKQYIAIAAQGVGFYVLVFENNEFRIMDHRNIYILTVLFLNDPYHH